MTDSYTVVEASRVLGISEKRVRQLVDRLDVVEARPLRVSMESVHRMREERRAVPPVGGGVAGQRVDHPEHVLADLLATDGRLRRAPRRSGGVTMNRPSLRGKTVSVTRRPGMVFGPGEPVVGVVIAHGPRVIALRRTDGKSEWANGSTYAEFPLSVVDVAVVGE